MIGGFFTYIFVKRKTRSGKYKLYPTYLALVALFLVPIVPVWKTVGDMMSVGSIWVDGCVDPPNPLK
jgi:hypothetical protein